MKAILKINGEEKELGCVVCGNTEFNKRIVKTAVANIQYSCGQEYQNGYRDEELVVLSCEKCGFVHPFEKERVENVTEINPYDCDVIIGEIEED